MDILQWVYLYSKYFIALNPGLYFILSRLKIEAQKKREKTGQ